MGLMNCISCKGPFVKSGSLSLCSQCLRNEAQLFESYYQRLLRATKNSSIAKLCHGTELDRHRLTNALNYRLGLGNVVHLPSLKPGNCYVCREPHSNPGCRESACLTCLDKLFVSLSRTNNAFKAPTGAAPKQPSSVEHVLDTTRSELETHQQTIQALKAELERYRFHFGELPNSNIRVSDTIATEMAYGVKPNTATPKSEDILSVLEDDNHTLSSDDWQQMEEEFGLVGKPSPTARTGFRSA